MKSPKIKMSNKTREAIMGHASNPFVGSYRVGVYQDILNQQAVLINAGFPNNDMAYYNKETKLIREEALEALANKAEPKEYSFFGILFFAPLYFIYRGNYKHAAFSFLAAIPTIGLSSIIYACMKSKIKKV